MAGPAQTLTDADIEQQAAPQTLADADIDAHGQKAASFLDQVARVGQGFYNNTIKPAVDTAQAVGQAVAHPLDTASAIVNSPAVQHPVDTAVAAAKQSYDTHMKMLADAKASAAKGDYDDAISRGFNALVPVLGPSVQASRDKIKNGDMTGAGEALGDLANVLLMVPGAGEAALSKVGELGDFAQTAAAAGKAAIKAGGADVAKGAGKVAAGAAIPAGLAFVPGGEAIKVGAEAAGVPLAGKLVTQGAKQIGQGVKTGWAAGKEAGVAAKLQRAADSQSATIRRLTDAFDPNTAKPTMELSSPIPAQEPAGTAPMAPMDKPMPAKGPPDAPLPEPTPNTQQLPLKPSSGIQPDNSVPQPRTVTRAEAMTPTVARNLGVGDKFVNPDGSTMVLKRVSLDDVDPDPGNKIYEDKVAQYQANGYDVTPELRIKDDGRYQVFEGHHRITADARNGADTIAAWVPDKPAPTEVQTIPFSKPDQPPEFYANKARAAKAPDEQKLAEYMNQGGITAADTRQMTDAQWEQAARAAGVKQPTAGGQDRIRFHLNRLSNPQASPQLVKRLQDTGGLSIAQQLQRAMGQ